MNLRHATVPAYLAACLIFGGSSAAGFAANIVLQLAAIPLLLVSVLTPSQNLLAVPATRLLALAALLACLFLVQIIPLPPALWTALPGRDDVERGFRLLDQPVPWLPISLAPQRTLGNLIWLLPQFAILLAVVRLGAFRVNSIAWTIVAVTLLSVAIGAMQVAGGMRSAWYLYEVTNRGYAVGFFANNNHMATLLVASMPFLAALMSMALGKSRRAKSSSGLVVLTTTALLIVFVGLAINTSLAGIGLAVPTAGASLLLARSRRKSVPRWAFPAVGALAIAAVAVVLVAPVGNNLTGDVARTSNESRLISFSGTLAAAENHFPLGSGIGTFQQIYRAGEDPREVTNVYMNHAHGDYFEIALETGLPGLALVALFLYWWGRRTIAIWYAEDQDLFARAATIASAAILAHSLVDYPLRTAAISSLFVVCVALMAGPRPSAARRVRAAEGGVRHLSAD